MAENCDKRQHPENLHPGTMRIISLRMNYMPEAADQIDTLKNPSKAYISRYALGRDYHKLIRKRLASLAKRIESYAIEHAIHPSPSQRPFVDSAPVFERKIAEKAGLGWTGKHTLILNKNEGSWFFLGEIFTNLSLPISTKQHENQCGECSACLKICPTDAFPQPYELDASRCISYLTIEYDGVIAEEFREAIGNRIFGCDDCQVICPWNKPSTKGKEMDFSPRHQLDNIELLSLFQWTEEEFLTRTQGSAIRRTGYRNWLRNISIGLGNANKDLRILEALKNKQESADAVLAEHLDWAIAKQSSTLPTRRKRKAHDPRKKAPKTAPKTA